MIPLAHAEDAAHEGAASDGHGDSGIPVSTLALQGANFLLFALIVAYFARRPISDALHNRANNVRRQLDESARLRDEAEARYAEIESRLVTLDRRIDEMKDAADAEASAEAARIAERADADVKRIQETAERTIREEAARARNEIRAEAVAQAAGLARETLTRSVTKEDQDRLAGEFLGAVQNGRKGEA